MKPGRQTAITEIISEMKIETQQQLIDALAARGFRATQATLSRDIRDLNLVKEPDPGGRSHYVRRVEPDTGNDGTLRSIMRQSVIFYETAQNLIVLKTFPGLASAACAAIDGMHVPGLVGTIAGDDTGFLAMKSAEYAEELVNRIHELV